jgi:hypothetical protein
VRIIGHCDKGTAGKYREAFATSLQMMRGCVGARAPAGQGNVWAQFLTLPTGTSKTSHNGPISSLRRSKYIAEKFGASHPKLFPALLTSLALRVRYDLSAALWSGSSTHNLLFCTCKSLRQDATTATPRCAFVLGIRPDVIPSGCDSKGPKRRL